MAVIEAGRVSLGGNSFSGALQPHMIPPPPGGLLTVGAMRTQLSAYPATYRSNRRIAEYLQGAASSGGRAGGGTRSVSSRLNQMGSGGVRALSSIGQRGEDPSTRREDPSAGEFVCFWV